MVKSFILCFLLWVGSCHSFAQPIVQYEMSAEDQLPAAMVESNGYFYYAYNYITSDGWQDSIKSCIRKVNPSNQVVAEVWIDTSWLHDMYIWNDTLGAVLSKIYPSIGSPSTGSPQSLAVHTFDAQLVPFSDTTADNILLNSSAFRFSDLLVSDTLIYVLGFEHDSSWNSFNNSIIATIYKDRILNYRMTDVFIEKGDLFRTDSGFVIVGESPFGWAAGFPAADYKLVDLDQSFNVRDTASNAKSTNHQISKINTVRNSDSTLLSCWNEFVHPTWDSLQSSLYLGVVCACYDQHLDTLFTVNLNQDNGINERLGYFGMDMVSTDSIWITTSLGGNIAGEQQFGPRYYGVYCMNSSGTVFWDTTFYSADPVDYVPWRIKALNNGGSMVIGEMSAPVSSDFDVHFFVIDKFGNAPLNAGHVSTSQGLDVFIYPNPASEYVVLSGSSVSNYNISVYDANGRLIDERKSIFSSEAMIPISAWESGLYFFRVQDEDGRSKVLKLIKD